MTPSRVVSTSPDNTEILAALGCAASLVGISKHCDFPENIGDGRPVISDFATVEVDAVLALKPDVVFCSTYYQANIVKALVDNHCRVFVTQPSDLASIYTNIRLIANLMGCMEAGAALVAGMQTAMAPQPANGLKVFAEEWGDPIVYAAPWIHEMIALAGGTPVLTELLPYTHTNGRIVTPEQVLETQADVVLLPWCGVHGRVPVHKVTGRPGWDALPAVQKSQVFPLEDSYFVRPGPRLVEGYRLLVNMLADCR